MTSTEEVTRTYIVDPALARDELGRDPADLAHYVDQRGDQDVAAAMIEGTEVEALCGYRWVPFRDPVKHPVCSTCVEVLDRMTR